MKTCQVCATDCDSDAETCGNCGEASWDESTADTQSEKTKSAKPAKKSAAKRSDE